MSNVELGKRIGYELKRVDTALRAAMESALRPLGLTVGRYACLELLDQSPELSNSELARRAFVSRQAMHIVLRDLESAGLVARPATAPQGRVLPVRLTTAGRRKLATARRRVLAIEERMTAGLSGRRRAALLGELADLAERLGDPG